MSSKIMKKVKIIKKSNHPDLFCRFSELSGELGGVPVGDSGFVGSSFAPKLLTKNASPDFPSFIDISERTPLTVM